MLQCWYHMVISQQVAVIFMAQKVTIAMIQPVKNTLGVFLKTLKNTKTAR